MQEIDVECVSDDEYAILEAALAQAEQKSLPRDVQLQVQGGNVEDIDDIEDVPPTLSRAEKNRRAGLYVTDITSSEWCQLQVSPTHTYSCQHDTPC